MINTILFMPEHKFVLAVPESLESINVILVKVMLESTASSPAREFILLVRAGRVFDTVTHRFNAFTFESDAALSEVHQEFYISTKHSEPAYLPSTVFDAIQAQPAVSGKRQLVPVWVDETDVGVRGLMYNVTRKTFRVALTAISSPVFDLISDEAWTAAQTLNGIKGCMTFADFRDNVIQGRYVPKCPELSAHKLKTMYEPQPDMPVELVLANRKYR